MSTIPAHFMWRNLCQRRKKLARRDEAYTRLDYTVRIRPQKWVISLTGYYEKIVVSQGVTEVWRYEKLNTKGGGKKERDGDGPGKEAEANYRKRQRERRNRIRQLVCTNFDSGSKFVTLTFNNRQEFDLSDVKACNKHFKQFIQRMKRRFPELRYVAVIEFQKRGAVHYHMICNLPFVKKSELQTIWGAGFVKVNRIDKVDNVGAYVIKYMCKDTEDKRLQGLKAYNCSKGLQEPIELTTWRDEDSEAWKIVHDRLERESPSYVAAYESDNAGKIEYRQYNSNRLHGNGQASKSQGLSDDLGHFDSQNSLIASF